ncbi:hypothetical protein COOONC_12123 [Cooperia oncophora]
MATKGDRMNFFDRLKNVADVLLGQMYFDSTFMEETRIFRTKFGSHFKDHAELLADTSYVFINSNPYIDYPRPMLHKTVPIGGIAVRVDSARDMLSKVPIFADQTRNANMVAKHGGAVVVTKSALKCPKTLKEALKRTLYDPSFADSAKRLSQMLLNQPISAKQLLVRHSEFAARPVNINAFKQQLESNLDACRTSTPTADVYHFMAYYLIDIFLVAACTITVIAFVVIKIVSRIFWLKVKRKKE